MRPQIPPGFEVVYDPDEASKSPADDAASYLVARGIEPLHAAAIAGNIAQESNFNPSVVGDKGSAFGLAQWRLDRRDALETFARNRGVPASDKYAQLDFLVDEAHRRGDIAALRGVSTPSDAAKVFADRFERPSPVHANYQNRASVAERVFRGLSGAASDFFVKPAQAADVPQVPGVMTDIPPIPEGFVIEGQDTPPIPEGFVLESEVPDSIQAPAPLEAPAPAPYGLRPDGTPKGKGFLGELKRPDGGVMTEYSIGVNLDGKEIDIPTLVPTLDQSEVDYILKMQDSDTMPESIAQKAVEHAKMRLAKGLPVFAQDNESPQPSFEQAFINPHIQEAKAAQTIPPAEELYPGHPSLQDRSFSGTDIGQRVIGMNEVSRIGSQIDKLATQWNTLDAAEREQLPDGVPRMTPQQVSAEKNRLQGEILALKAELQRAQQIAPPLSPEVGQAVQAMDNYEFGPALDNIGGIASEVLAPSLVASLPTLAGTLAARQFGRLPAALAGFGGSYELDFGSRLADALATAEQQGPINAQGVIQAAGDAEKASSLVGAASALGSSLAPALSASDGVGKTIAKLGATLLAEPVAEGSAEAGAQAITRDKLSPAEIGLESIMSVPGAIGDVAGATLARRGMVQPEQSGISGQSQTPETPPIPPQPAAPKPVPQPPNFTAQPDYGTAYPQQAPGDFTPATPPEVTPNGQEEEGRQGLLNEPAPDPMAEPARAPQASQSVEPEPFLPLGGNGSMTKDEYQSLIGRDGLPFDDRERQLRIDEYGLLSGGTVVSFKTASRAKQALANAEGSDVALKGKYQVVGRGNGSARSFYVLPTYETYMEKMAGNRIASVGAKDGASIQTYSTADYSAADTATLDGAKSSGLSNNFDAWKDLHNGDEQAATEMLNLPSGVQFERTAKMVQDRFEFPEIKKEANLNYRHATDQMLDAYRNLRGLANALGLSDRQMSVGGKVTLQLGKGLAKFRGMYSWKPPAERNIKISGRYRSFAHEWFHAMDETMAGLDNPRMLTNARKSDTLSPEALAAFENVRKAVLGGDFLQNARALDAAKGSSYWAQRIEMMARAFETYAARKFPGEDFIHKGGWYQEPKQQQYYPQGAQMDQIADAFDAFFEKYAEGTGEQPAPEVGEVVDLYQHPATLPKERGSFVGGTIQFMHTALRLVRDIAREAIQYPGRAARLAYEAGRHPVDNARAARKKLNDLREKFQAQGLVRAFMPAQSEAALAMARAKPLNTALKKVVRLLVSDPGSGEAYAQAMDSANQQVRTQFHNKLDAILTSLKIDGRSKSDNEILTRIMTAASEADLREARKAAVDAGRPELSKAAPHLRRMMDDVYAYAMEVYEANGLSIGYTQEGYLPRVLDLDAVNDNRDAFLADLVELYTAEGAEDPQQAAENYALSAVVGDPYTNSILPGENLLKGRKLSAAADKILAKWYVQDPVTRMQRYVDRIVPRVEYMRRFGEDGKTLDKLFKEAANHPTQPTTTKELGVLKQLVEAATGKQQHFGRREIENAAKDLYMITVMPMLARASIMNVLDGLWIGARLADDPEFNAGAETVKAAGQFMYQAFKDIFNMPDADREMAKVIGTIAEHAADIASHNYGFEDSSGTIDWRSRALTNYWKTTLQTGSSNTTGAMITRMGRKYIAGWLERAVKGDKQAIKELADLNVLPDQIEPYHKWLTEETDKGLVIGSDGFKRMEQSEMGRLHMKAMYSLTEQVRQNAKLTDKPFAASVPGLRAFYGIMSYTYAFYKHVIKFQYKRAKGHVRDGEWGALGGQAARWTTAAALMTLATVAIQEGVRDPLFGETDREDKDKLWLDVLQGLDRTFPMPVPTTLLNMFMAVKYNMPVANRILGAHVGTFAKHLQGLVGYFARDPENSADQRSIDRAAMSAVYNLMVLPAGYIGLNLLPAGPMPIMGAKAVAQAFASSKRTQDRVKDFAAPRKQKGRGRTQSRVTPR